MSNNSTFIECCKSGDFLSAIEMKNELQKIDANKNIFDENEEYLYDLILDYDFDYKKKTPQTIKMLKWYYTNLSEVFKIKHAKKYISYAIYYLDIELVNLILETNSESMNDIFNDNDIIHDILNEIDETDKNNNTTFIYFYNLILKNNCIFDHYILSFIQNAFNAGNFDLVEYLLNDTIEYFNKPENSKKLMKLFEFLIEEYNACLDAKSNDKDIYLKFINELPEKFPNIIKYEQLTNYYFIDENKKPMFLARIGNDSNF